MKLTKYKLLEKKPKMLAIEIICLIIIIGVLTMSLSFKTYDIDYLKLKVIKENDGYLGVINIYETNTMKFNNKTLIKINGEKRNHEIIRVNDLTGDLELGLNYQEVIMQIDLKEYEKIENIYLNITLFNNEQSLFKKTINKFI